MSKKLDASTLLICHQDNHYRMECNLSIQELESFILSVINQRVAAVSIKLLNGGVFILTKAMIDLGAVIKIF